MRKNRNLNKNKFQIKFLHVYWLIITLLLISTVFVMVQTSSLGAKLNELEKEEARLINEKQILSSEVVIQSSLIQIEDKADYLGFYKPERTLYITGKETVAKLP